MIKEVFLAVVIMIASGSYALQAESGAIKYALNHQDWWITAPKHGSWKLGEESAPLQMVVFLDDSEASRLFREEILPRLTEDYIKNGKLKVSLKPIVTPQNWKNEMKRYEEAGEFTCDKESTEDFIKCQESNIREFEQAAFDLHRLHGAGMSPILFLGIDKTRERIDGLPDYEKLRKKIRLYQVQIGD